MTRLTSYEAGAPSWVAQLSPDVEASRHFYGPVLGWDYANIADAEQPPFYLAHVDGDPVASLTGPVDAGTWIVAVCVTDLDEARAAAERTGGTAPGDSVDIATLGRFHRLHDPAGAEVHAVQCLPDRGAFRVEEAGAWTTSTLAGAAPDDVEDFYAAVFGWRITASASARRFRDPAGSVVGLLEPAPRAAAWTPGFGVSDLEASIETALALDGELLMEPSVGPTGGVRAILTDPTGARFALDHGAEL